MLDTSRHGPDPTISPLPTQTETAQVPDVISIYSKIPRSLLELLFTKVNLMKDQEFCQLAVFTVVVFLIP